MLLQIKGKVLTTGIGKAGHIAHKFAATLCSTATPAIFLHAGEAAHGDLGIVEPEDVVIAFSTSGKSVEVLEVLELSRHLGVSHIIGITSHPDSKLRDLSDFVLDMGEIEEACPIGLTPSSSMAVMLAISDAIALALLQAKGVTARGLWQATPWWLSWQICTHRQHAAPGGLETVAPGFLFDSPCTSTRRLRPIILGLKPAPKPARGVVFLQKASEIVVYECCKPSILIGRATARQCLRSRTSNMPKIQCRASAREKPW